MQRAMSDHLTTTSPVFFRSQALGHRVLFVRPIDTGCTWRSSWMGTGGGPDGVDAAASGVTAKVQRRSVEWSRHHPTSASTS